MHHLQDGTSLLYTPKNLAPGTPSVASHFRFALAANQFDFSSVDILKISSH
jgi:hypothetical protein